MAPFNLPSSPELRSFTEALRSVSPSVADAVTGVLASTLALPAARLAVAATFAMEARINCMSEESAILLPSPEAIASNSPIALSMKVLACPNSPSAAATKELAILSSTLPKAPLFSPDPNRSTALPTARRKVCTLVRRLPLSSAALAARSEAESTAAALTLTEAIDVPAKDPGFSVPTPDISPMALPTSCCPWP